MLRRLATWSTVISGSPTSALASRMYLQLSAGVRPRSGLVAVPPVILHWFAPVLCPLSVFNGHSAANSSTAAYSWLRTLERLPTVTQIRYVYAFYSRSIDSTGYFDVQV